MTLVVVRDRQEIYDRLHQARQSLPQQRAARISVRAPGLDEQVRHDLESEIQAVLDRTLQRVRSARPTAGGEPPSDDNIREQIEAARAQFSSSRAPEPRQRPLSNGGIRVATSGLNLPREDRRAFHSEARRLVQERLAGMSPDLGRQSVTVCGCGIDNCCWPPAGELADLTPFAPLSQFTTNPITIALFFNGDIGIHGDAIRFQIWPTERDAWPPDQIMVGLRIDASQDPDQWAKEITGWTICQCTVQTDHQEGATTDYNWMLINMETVDTLAFRKAVFLGWHNSGYFGPTPSFFWNLLGGTTLTFDWISDDI